APGSGGLRGPQGVKRRDRGRRVHVRQPPPCEPRCVRAEQSRPHHAGAGAGAGARTRGDPGQRRVARHGPPGHDRQGVRGRAGGGGSGPRWAGLDPTTARVAWTLLVIGGAMTLVYILRNVLLLLAFSVFFAYLIFPLVEATQRWVPGLRSRTRAIVLVYLVL